jgi:hypothetical protein
MNKKKLMMFGLPILMIGLVTAALLSHLGQIITTVDVEQGLYLDGNDWETPTEESFEMTSFKSGRFLSEHNLDNQANIDADVNLSTTCEYDGSYSNDSCEYIEVSYLLPIDFAYSQIWTENGDVLVEINDTDDGWLQWTYTAVTPSTSGTLKMTVEIDNPTGFGITTFDDGSHDGWYYYDADGVVRISDYDGSNKISGFDFVETNLVTEGLQVRIRKDVLNNTFMWQGFANFHLAANWIELDKSGSPWVPTGVGVIRQAMVQPLNVPSNSIVEFVTKTQFPIETIPGEYTLKTKIKPVE